MRGRSPRRRSDRSAATRVFEGRQADRAHGLLLAPGMWSVFKHWLPGPPLATAQAVHERLPKRVALAVFSSDALSSVAYATEEILLVLAVAAAATNGASFRYVVPISLAIVGLLWIVAFSYRQTIHAYPSGGGAYIVAKDNLGTLAGLIAGA